MMGFARAKRMGSSVRFFATSCTLRDALGWRVLLAVCVVGLSSCALAADPLATVLVSVKEAGAVAVVGAQVALVPPGTDMKRVVRGISDGDGRVLLQAPPGTYGVTATSPGRVEAYLPGIEIHAPEQAMVEVEMRPGGRGVYGRLVSADGMPLRDGMVAFGRISDQKGDLFLATVTDDRFDITLTDGNYVVVATTPGGQVQSRRVVIGPDVREVVVAFEPQPSPAPAEVKAWIRQHLVPLRTAEAESGFDDLAPLKPIIGSARVVSLGEATHGTREFFQMKHRLVEFMVEELGFTLFGIEANLSEARAVNDYVLHGRGDPEKALRGLYFWTWDTEEVLTMLRWMRSYNGRAAPDRRVQFFGFDMQVPKVAYEQLRDYLRDVDPELSRAIEPNLPPITALRKSDAGSSVLRADIDAALRKVSDKMSQARSDYIARSSEAALADASENVGVLRQFLDYVPQRYPEAGTLRDRAMAQNVLATLARHPGARAALWAHNVHIANAPYAAGTISSMGMQLREALGRQMLILGFAFRQGQFQAVDGGPERKGLTVFEVGADPAATLGEALASAEAPIGIIDLRTLPASGPVARWFSAPQKSRMAGGDFAYSDDSLIPERVAASYDALVFIERTTRARPNP